MPKEADEFAARIYFEMYSSFKKDIYKKLTIDSVNKAAENNTIFLLEENIKLIHVISNIFAIQIAEVINRECPKKQVDICEKYNLQKCIVNVIKYDLLSMKFQTIPMLVDVLGIEQIKDISLSYSMLNNKLTEMDRKLQEFKSLLRTRYFVDYFGGAVI